VLRSGQKCLSNTAKEGNIWLSKKWDGCYPSLEGGKDSKPLYIYIGFEDRERTLVELKALFLKTLFH
jgi:hypothetical protein